MTVFSDKRLLRDGIRTVEEVRPMLREETCGMESGKAEAAEVGDLYESCK